MHNGRGKTPRPLCSVHSSDGLLAGHRQEDLDELSLQRSAGICAGYARCGAAYRCAKRQRRASRSRAQHGAVHRNSVVLDSVELIDRPCQGRRPVHW